MTCLDDPVPIDDSPNKKPKQMREYGECPECGGRAKSAGETSSKEFMQCGYCDNSFSEEK